MPRTWLRTAGRMSFRLAPITIIVAVLAVVAVFLTVQLGRPVPALTMTAWPAPMRALPGAPPHLAWPRQAEAAVGVSGVGVLASHGGDREVAIASVTKIMTAYQVLRDHPLVGAKPGPHIRVTSADAAVYARDKRQGQSVAKVRAGETLTERQALEAMLLPSGNNIAYLLANWDAGSQKAFVAKMNAGARALGMTRTHYADSSGFDPATVSTAGDQLRLALRAMTVPVFRQIVAMPQASLPVAGVVYNSNYGLGHDGIIGVKTGTSPQAGGCLVFAAVEKVSGKQVTVAGVILGVLATARQPSELTGVITDSERLLSSVRGHIERVRVVSPGTVLGVVHSAWTPRQAVIADKEVSVMGWPGMPVRVSVTPSALGRTVAVGQVVGRADITVDGEVSHLTLYANGTVGPPSLAWRLTRP